MKTLKLDDPESQQDLIELTKLISRTRKIIVLTGAGISRNAGIPDFRSSSGLYKRTYENGTIRCRELFDISIYRNAQTIQLFNTFMQKMYYDKVRCATPTKTHRFIKCLKAHKKLIRCYTQNIDGLERQLGMRTEFDQLKDWTHLDVVQLHGDLNTLKCNRCLTKYQWNEIYVNQKGAEEDAGLLIACPNCMEKYEKRHEAGKRCCSSSIGIIRPNIVLYGEEHPFGDVLARGLEKDMNRNPKLFLIFGTSLRVSGVKSLVRRLCRRIHQKNIDGRIAIINNTEISQSGWGQYIDYQVICDCDDWCEYVKQKVPRIFKPPRVKRVKVEDLCNDDNKENVNIESSKKREMKTTEVEAQHVKRLKREIIVV